MNIEQEGDNLVVRIPLKTTEVNPYDEKEVAYVVPNLVGIVAGNEFTLSYLLHLLYKGSVQEGSPILYFDTREELEEACKKFGIEVWVHPVCSVCGDVIRGSFSWNEKGGVCVDCEFEDRKSS